MRACNYLELTLNHFLSNIHLVMLKFVTSSLPFSLSISYPPFLAVVKLFAQRNWIFQPHRSLRARVKRGGQSGMLWCRPDLTRKFASRLGWLPYFFFLLLKMPRCTNQPYPTAGWNFADGEGSPTRPLRHGEARGTFESYIAYSTRGPRVRTLQKLAWQAWWYQLG